MFMGMGLGLVGILLTVLLLGGLIGGGIWLVRGIFPSSQPPAMPASREGLEPHEILDQRYARGEITREQYQTMKQDLN